MLPGHVEARGGFIEENKPRLVTAFPDLGHYAGQLNFLFFTSGQGMIASVTKMCDACVLHDLFDDLIQPGFLSRKVDLPISTISLTVKGKLT